MHCYFTHVYEANPEEGKRLTCIAVEDRGETIRNEFVYGARAFNCLKYITETLWGEVEISGTPEETYFGGWLERAIASSDNPETLKKRFVKAIRLKGTEEDLTFFEQKACEELIRFVKSYATEESILDYLIALWVYGFDKQEFSTEKFNADTQEFKKLAEEMLTKETRRSPRRKKLRTK